MYYNKAKLVALVLATTLFAGCATSKNIPMMVNSDPLGAQVLFQVKGEEVKQADWVYLGNTPLNIQRVISKAYLNDEHTVVIRVMKEGFIDQTKEFSGSNVNDVASDGERLFWNSVMIKGGQ